MRMHKFPATGGYVWRCSGQIPCGIRSGVRGRQAKAGHKEQVGL
jgi:hypothetical protein